MHKREVQHIILGFNSRGIKKKMIVGSNKTPNKIKIKEKKIEKRIRISIIKGTMEGQSRLIYQGKVI